MDGGSIVGIGLLVVHVLLFAGVGYALIELRKSRPDPVVGTEATGETSQTLGQAPQS